MTASLYQSGSTMGSLVEVVDMTLHSWRNNQEGAIGKARYGEFQGAAVSKRPKSLRGRFGKRPSLRLHSWRNNQEGAIGKARYGEFQGAAVSNRPKSLR